jgi:hypothetical protein
MKCTIETDIEKYEKQRKKKYLCGFRNMCSQRCKEECNHLK